MSQGQLDYRTRIGKAVKPSGPHTRLGQGAVGIKIAAQGWRWQNRVLLRLCPQLTCLFLPANKQIETEAEQENDMLEVPVIETRDQYASHNSMTCQVDASKEPLAGMGP